MTFPTDPDLPHLEPRGREMYCNPSLSGTNVLIPERIGFTSRGGHAQCAALAEKQTSSRSLTAPIVQSGLRY